jgi:hypothetical protein
MNTSYEYAGYPQNAYHPIRSQSPSTFNQQHQQQPQAPYQPAYPYPVPQQHQWPADNWSTYAPQFQQPPMQEIPFNSGPGRPDQPPQNPLDHRQYSAPQPIPGQDPRRAPDRPTPTTGQVAVVQQKRRRDKDPNGPTTSPPGIPGTPPGLDFMKVSTRLFLRVYFSLYI